jgi:isoleucyl-tRNA synthetase
MAPILPFTTEEAWESMPAYKGKAESIHLELFPSFKELWLDAEAQKEWEGLVGLREKVLKELEAAREQKLIGNSLEARVALNVPAPLMPLIQKYKGDLCTLFIVSNVVVDAAAGEELSIAAAKAPGNKCQRCWNYSTAVGTSASHPNFCKRCEDVLKEMNR